MHATAAAPSPYAIALIYVVAIAFFVWRMSRPQRTTVIGLWLRPVFLVFLTAFVVWSGNFAGLVLGQTPPPAWEVAAVLFVGAALGVPLGFLRGRHSEVKPTGRPGVMYVHSSPIIVIVWLAAFVARAALRFLMPGAQTGANIWGDGLLAFAVAAIVASCFAIYAKYRRVTQQPQTA